MSQETINLLKDLTAVIAMGALPVLVYLLSRGYTRSAKALNLPVNPEFVRMLEDLATLAIKYAEQEANKWLDRQRSDGAPEPAPLSGEQKKQLAVKGMQSLAPPGMTITPAQADVVIEAVVQKVKSIAPPPVSSDAGTSFYSIPPNVTPRRTL